MAPLTTQLSPLLTADVIEKLARQGIKTVAGFVHCELVPLSQTTGLPYKLLTNIQQSLLAQFTCPPKTAADLWHEQEETAALLPTGHLTNQDTFCPKGVQIREVPRYNPTSYNTRVSYHLSPLLCILLTIHPQGYSNVDKLLDGGLMTGEVTELTGVPSSGKTQLCHSIVSAVVLHTSSTVLWVDSNGGFSPSRLHTTLVTQGATEESCPGLLERVQIYRLFNLFEVFHLLEDVTKQVSNQSNWFQTNLHLLIVDSVTPLLSPLLGGHGGQGHALLSHLASQLRSIAYEHSMAVLCTNNTVSNMSGGEEVKPSLGQTWSYVPHTRISLSLPPPTHHSLSHHHTHGTSQGREDGRSERVATLSKSSRSVSSVESELERLHCIYGTDMSKL